MERKITRKGPHQPEITLPPETTPEEELFLRKLYQNMDDDTSSIQTMPADYGHAIAGLAIYTLSNSQPDPNIRRDQLRSKAQELVDQFGDAIIPLLRDELKLALE